MNNFVSLKNPELSRWPDEFCLTFEKGQKGYDELVAELGYADENTHITNVDTQSIGVRAHSLPIENEMVCDTLGIPVEMGMEICSPDATHLIVSVCDEDGEPLPGEAANNHTLDACGWPTLLAAAKLYGAALTRMEPPYTADCLNHALDVARGKSLLMERYGKTVAIHSDGYLPMSIHDLVVETTKVLTSRFGNAVFTGGYMQHSYTTCGWAMPGIARKLNEVYQKAVKNANLYFTLDNFTPGVRFYSSDTQASAARLIPVFITNRGTEIQLVEGIAVRHEHRVNSTVQGIDLYVESIQGIYALFEASAEKAKALSDIDIAYVCNTIVGVCHKVGIPKKYGSVAYEEAKTLIGDNPCSALDVYIMLSNMTSYIANVMQVPPSTVLDMQEKTAKILAFRRETWNDLDLPGEVSW